MKIQITTIGLLAVLILVGLAQAQTATVSSNQPPIVEVGVSPSILPTYMIVPVWGSVTDDGLPNPPGMVTATWSKISGPGTATFRTVYPDYSVLSPIVQFDQPGSYVLRLTAFDGELTAYDELTYVASIPPLIGDLNNDGVVDWADFSIFAAHWFDNGCEAPDWCGGADLDKSGQVDWGDFAIFAAHWLECVSVGCVPEMAWHVEPECALGIAQEQDELSTAEDLDATRFTVTVEEQYIHFEDMIKANCCPGKLELQMTVEGSQITILETQEMEGCWCLCDFPATATLGPLADGTYTVEVIDPYGVSLGTVQVTIGQSQ